MDQNNEPKVNEAESLPESNMVENTPAPESKESTSAQTPSSLEKSEKKGRGPVIIIGVLLAICIVIAIVCAVLTSAFGLFANQVAEEVGNLSEEELQNYINDIENEVANELDQIEENNTESTVSQRSTTASSSDFTSLTEQGITISYPKTWERDDSFITEGTGLFQFFAPQQNVDDTFRENFSLGIEDTGDSSVTLDEYVGASVTELEKAFTDTEFSVTDTNLGKYAAKELVYETSAGGYTLKILQVVTVVDGVGYYFTYAGEGTNYNMYIQDMYYVINTFEIN